MVFFVKRGLLIGCLSCLITSFSFSDPSFTIAVDKIDGEIQYDITSPLDNGASRLIFPYDNTIAEITATYNINQYRVSLNAATSLSKGSSKGEDFDWSEGLPIIYSESRSNIHDMKKFGIEVAKQFRNHKNIFLFGRLDYRDMNMDWTDTNQTGTNGNTAVNGKTIDFNQKGYLFSTGFNYYLPLSQSVLLVLTPYFHVAYIDLETEYLMRDLVTSQKSYPWGAGAQINLEKSFKEYGTLGLHLGYNYVEDTSATMKFTTKSSGSTYAKLPSDYKEDRLKFGLYYRYKF
jgi:hypothetical protein